MDDIPHIKSKITVSPVAIYGERDLYRLEGKLYEIKYSGESVEIGSVRGVYMHVYDNEHAIDLLDSQTATLYAKGVRTIKGDVFQWLSLDNLQIYPEWQGNKYGWRLAAEVICLFEQPHTIVVVNPGPIQELWPIESEEDVEAVEKQLFKYWYDFGFRPIKEGSEFYIHDLTYAWPEGSWMSEQ